MRHEEISVDLKEISFEFFYWFSRFEFVLKENNLLKDNTEGAKAEPSWQSFLEKHKEKYQTTEEAKRLIELHPKRQVVCRARGLDWRPVGIEHCNNDLCKVIAMLLTVRNNLFHGGKHGDIYVDSKERNFELLSVGKIVLDQMARQFDFENDYTRYY